VQAREQILGAAIIQETPRYDGRVPKVTFLAGKRKHTNLSPASFPYEDHGKPESLLDVAMNNHFNLETWRAAEAAPAPPVT